MHNYCILCHERVTVHGTGYQQNCTTNHFPWRLYNTTGEEDLSRKNAIWHAKCQCKCEVSSLSCTRTYSTASRYHRILHQKELRAKSWRIRASEEWEARGRTQQWPRRRASEDQRQLLMLVDRWRTVTGVWAKQAGHGPARTPIFLFNTGLM